MLYSVWVWLDHNIELAMGRHTHTHTWTRAQPHTHTHTHTRTHTYMDVHAHTHTHRRTPSTDGNVFHTHLALSGDPSSGAAHKSRSFCALHHVCVRNGDGHGRLHTFNR